MGHSLPTPSLMYTTYCIWVSWQISESNLQGTYFCNGGKKEVPGILNWLNYPRPFISFSHRGCLTQSGSKHYIKSCQIYSISSQRWQFAYTYFWLQAPPIVLKIHKWCSTLPNCSLKQLHAIKGKKKSHFQQSFRRLDDEGTRQVSVLLNDKWAWILLFF